MPEIIRRFGPFIRINQSIEEREALLKSQEKLSDAERGAYIANHAHLGDEIVDINVAIMEVAAKADKELLLRTPLEGFGYLSKGRVRWLLTQRRLTPDLEEEKLIDMSESLPVPGAVGRSLKRLVAAAHH
jgi:hypothetical protein